MAAAMNHEAIRTFAVDQAFEYMRQHARNGNAHSMWLARRAISFLWSAQPRIDPE
jgi:hypothetical protein